MEFIRRKMKKLKRRFSLRKSAIRSQGDKVVSLHRVKISNADIYQQSASASQRSIRCLLATEYKDRKSQELDDVVLEIMGSKKSTASIFGRPIQNELAICFESITTSGLTNEQRRDLLDAYLSPVNCKLIGAPRLNPEVKKAITDLDIKRDQIIRSRQKQISSAIACLGEAITLLFSKDTRDPTVRRLIMDSARILCDSQYNDSITRRNYIFSSLKGDLKKELIDTKINDMLFGKEEAQSSKTEDSKNKSENNSKVQIATLLRKISIPKVRSPNRNLISKDQKIHDTLAHKKTHDQHDNKKVQDSHAHKIHDQYNQNTHSPHDQKKIQSSSYRNPKKTIKDIIVVPLEKDTLRSPRSSKQTNRRDSRQLQKLPTQSKASTNSSHRRR